ncbi:Low-density lipoprotein receptor-related protein 6 [Trichinella sp. T9]|nr:Low-density lipoprotein receptor-related protein 6 [Trichinella sp. T9]
MYIVNVLLILLSLHCIGSPENFPKFMVLNQTEEIGIVSYDENKKNYTAVVRHLESCMAMDVLIKDDLIFYTDNHDQLVKINVRRTHQELSVVARIVFPSSGSISVEWVTNKVYWYDLETNRIEVVNVDHMPAYRKVLIFENLHNVHGIAVDPIHSYIFFHNFAHRHSIERAWLDGSHRKTIFRSGYSLPKSLTVHHGEGRIYWIDNDDNRILSTRLDGSMLIVVVKNLSRPFVLAVFESLVFWSDIYDAGIFWCSIKNCVRPERLRVHQIKPYALKIYDSRSQPNKEENPCENNAVCSHLCFLIPEAPYWSCGCPTGVKMSPDNITCLDGPEEILIVARRSDIRILSLDTPDYSDYALNVQSIKQAVAVDYDPVEKFVYWSDNDQKMIRRAKLDGSEETDIVMNEFGLSDGIAFDWVARNVYWTDAQMDRIEVARSDGSARRILISTGLSQPRAIAVDPKRGLLFWSDWDEAKPKIERAYLDGSSRTTWISFNAKRWPNGLALDIENGRVYWAEATVGIIESADMVDALNRRVTLRQSHGHIYGFSLLGDYVYWSDWERRSLCRAHKVDGKDQTDLHENMADLMGIKAAYSKKVLRKIVLLIKELSCVKNNKRFVISEITNDCSIRNGNCSHLCLYRPTGRVCLCPIGWELGEDGTTCTVPVAFLMFTQRDNNDILRVSLSSTLANLDRLRLLNVSQPIALDYCYSQNKIFWTGRYGSSGIISRAYMNGSGIEVLINSSIEHPEGFAIDWLAENMYWSDSGHHMIEMADLNGKSRRIVVWRGTNPRALVVHPVVGYLYWAEWLGPPRLERAELDGRNRITLLKDVGRIFALTVDYVNDRLYWSEVDMPSIQSIDLTGSARRLIVRERSIQPYVLTEYGDFLYWANWRKQAIEICDKTTGKNRSTLHLDLHFIINLVAVHALKQKGWNQCVIKKRHCESLFISAPDRSCRCACPTHFTLAADRRSCVAPETFLLISYNGFILRLKVKDRHDIDDYPMMTLPFSQQTRVRSLQYDPLSRRIFWLSTVSDHKMNRNTLRWAVDSGRTTEEIKLSRFDAEQPPYDIAFDPYSQTMFWSCEQTNTLNATRIFNSNDIRPLGGIVASPEYSPRAVSLFPKKRYLLFANHGPSAGLVLCHMDGSNCHFIVSENIAHPEALTFDGDGNRIFWIDLGYKYISSVDCRGRSRKTLVYHVDHPSSLTIFKQMMYFVNQGVNKVEMVNKNSGNGRETVVERLRDLTSILAVDGDTAGMAVISRSPCLQKRCSHLCLLKVESDNRPMEAECACPENMALDSSGVRCLPVVQCRQWEWKCKDKLQCIDHSNYCDKVVHCADGSDESETCIRCQLDEFECANERKCIHRLNICDGQPDCEDGSDEYCFCSEPANQFHCAGPEPHSGVCIARSWLCDGVEQCQDGSDELYCGASESGSKWKKLIFPTKDTVTYIIVVVVGFGVFFVLLLVMYVFCRRPNGLNVQPVEIELVNTTTAEGSGARTVSTTVEYRYRLGVGKPSILSRSVEPLHSRPDLTGKSSSSNSDSGVKIGITLPPINPPPSPVSGTVISTCSSDAQRIGKWLLQANRNASLFAVGEAATFHPFSCYRGNSPPPPYSASVEMSNLAAICKAKPKMIGSIAIAESFPEMATKSTVEKKEKHDDEKITEEEEEEPEDLAIEQEEIDSNASQPLLSGSSNPVPPPPSPRSSGSVASSVIRRCAVSKQRPYLTRSPRNPPPSPNELSDASSNIN